MKMLSQERDDFSSNRHSALSFCLSMISAQTLRVCREGKPLPTIGSWPEGMLFRIMLSRLQRTAPARGGRAARPQKPPARKKVPFRGTGLCARGRTHQINLEFGDPRLGLRMQSNPYQND